MPTSRSSIRRFNGRSTPIASVRRVGILPSPAGKSADEPIPSSWGGKFATRPRNSIGIMAASFLIIDGYNLMHAAGMARARYGPGDLQRARQRLLKLLVRTLTKPELQRATIVFDAREAPPHLPHTWTLSGMRILFANPDGDADVMIEELIAVHTSP